MHSERNYLKFEYALQHKATGQFYNGKNTECDFSLTKILMNVYTYNEHGAYDKLRSSKWFSENFKVVKIF